MKNVLPKVGNKPLLKGVDLSSNAGMSLMIILTTLTVSAIALRGIMSIGAIRQRSQAQSFVPIQLVQIRGNIANLLRNPNSWKVTYQNATNTNLACMIGSGDCSTPSGSLIAEIDDAYGTPVYLLNNATWTSQNGVAPDGTSCNKFPSIQCPFAIQVNWKCNACTSGPNYNLSFQITLKYDPEMPNSTGPDTARSPDAILLNESNYSAPYFSQNTTNSYFNHF